LERFKIYLGWEFLSLSVVLPFFPGISRLSSPIPLGLHPKSLKGQSIWSFQHQMVVYFDRPDFRDWERNLWSGTDHGRIDCGKSDWVSRIAISEMHNANIL
jgi:hypothetical protein